MYTHMKNRCANIHFYILLYFELDLQDFNCILLCVLLNDWGPSPNYENGQPAEMLWRQCYFTRKVEA